MASSTDKLTPLQRDVLREFFRRERRFYLTGGAALAGFFLKHRQTTDLDLFTLDASAFEQGQRALELTAQALGATVETVRHEPEFRRLFVARGAESVVVDLVRERAPQLFGAKLDAQGVRLDPLEEIFTNKLTALVSRGEIRDLVDVLLIEREGLRVEDFVAPALAKDGGCTPATVAWVLSEISVGTDAELPAGIDPAELRAFLSDLIVRLRSVAYPK